MEKLELYLRKSLKKIPDYSKEYLYLEALEDGMTVSFNKKAKSGSLYYSLDKQEWNELTEAQTINSGEKVYFKGDLVPIGYRYDNGPKTDGIGVFSINKKCNICGNTMSLLYENDFLYKDILIGKEYTFYKLFNNCTTIQSAKNLILPAITLNNGCYEYMFSGCTSLTDAPELPATTLATDCYTSMFDNCIGLITGPSILPATNLISDCYRSMFKNCSSLITAPELPAKELEFGCYYYMFNGCSSLTTAPELPATKLAQYCYSFMFENCTNLNYIKVLFTTSPSYLYSQDWVKNVSPTGTFVKAEGVEIPTGTAGIPEGWIVETI